MTRSKTPPKPQKAKPDTSKPQMDLTQDQEHEIYVAYKHVFNGSYKCYRKPSYVKGHIDNPRAHPVAAAVLEKYGRGTVIRAVLTLLQAKVFKNEKYAKERFSTTESSPELDASEPSEVVQPPLDLKQKDDTSTNIDPPPIVSEGPIEVIEPVKVEQESDVQVSQVADKSSAKEETRPDTTPSPVKTTEAKVPTSCPDISDDVRILSPPQSPASSQKKKDTVAASTASTQAKPRFITQHLVLKRMQTILEHACFDFARENMPEILAIMEWDCPEAGELDIWMRHLGGKRFKELEKLARSKDVKIPLRLLMASMARLRNAAVHRDVVASRELTLLAGHAVQFCSVLQIPGSDALGILQTIRDSLETQLGALSGLKDEIDAELDNSLKEIARRRAELDALEESTIQEAQKEFESQQTITWNEVDSLIPFRHNEFSLLKVPMEQLGGAPPPWYNASFNLSPGMGIFHAPSQPDKLTRNWASSKLVRQHRARFPGYAMEALRSRATSFFSLIRRRWKV